MLFAFMAAEDKFSPQLLQSLYLPAIILCAAVGVVALVLLLVKKK